MSASVARKPPVQDATAHLPAADEPIAFIDLAAQRRAIGRELDEAVIRVFDHGGYIMGPEVAELERELAAFCGARHVISCSDGTTALSMVLLARGVGPGDAIICPSFTFAATAEVVALAGATPVFADVDEESFNLDPASARAALATARQKGLRPVGVIAVDLFGQPADYEPIEAFCREAGLWLISDAAQSFGAHYRGRKVGTIGLATTTSFFPAKPLGCYGDGGAIFTDDDELAATLKSLRVHGQGEHKYDNVRVGVNGRLDTVQAAVLLAKLRRFPAEIVARDEVAERYRTGLGDLVKIPEVAEGSSSVWAQYTLRLGPERSREAVQAKLAESGVPTAVYYVKPLHLQEAYSAYPVAGNGCPVSERHAREVLSLPMHGYLSEATQDRIIAACRSALG